MFHYMTMFVCTIASLAYLTMAMGYGKYYVGAVRAALTHITGQNLC